MKGESPRPGGGGQGGGHADDGGEDEEEEEHCLQRAPHHLQGLLLTVSCPVGIFIRPEWDVFIWIHLHHNTWMQASSLEAVDIFSKMFCPTDWLSRLPGFERQYINAVQVLQTQHRNQSIEKNIDIVQ